MMQNIKFSDFILSIAFVTIIYLTTLSMPFFESIEWVQANDVYSYLKISLSYPHFPEDKIASHFAYRFLPHYLVGSIATFLNIEIGISYAIVNFIFTWGIIFFSLRTIRLFNPESNISIILALIYFFSPFALRLNMFSPGLLADTVHIFGLVVCLHAIGLKNNYWLLIGILIAATGKQFIILEIPGILILFIGMLKNKNSKLYVAIWALILVIYTILIYTGLNYFSKSFSDANSISVLTFFSIFFWIFSSSFSYQLLFEHIFRLMLPILPFFILTFGIRNNLNSKKLISYKSIGLLMIFIAPFAYGFLPGPEVQMGNQSRYSSVGLIALILLLLDWMSDIFINWDYRFGLLTIFYIFFHSYHHKYTIFPSYQIVTLVSQIISFVIMIYLIRIINKLNNCKN